MARYPPPGHCQPMNPFNNNIRPPRQNNPSNHGNMWQWNQPPPAPRQQNMCNGNTRPQNDNTLQQNMCNGNTRQQHNDSSQAINMTNGNTWPQNMNKGNTWSQNMNNGNTRPQNMGNGNARPQNMGNGNTMPQNMGNGNTWSHNMGNGNARPQNMGNGNTMPQNMGNGNTRPQNMGNGNTMPQNMSNGNTMPQNGNHPQQGFRQRFNSPGPPNMDFGMFHSPTQWTGQEWGAPSPTNHQVPFNYRPQGPRPFHQQGPRGQRPNNKNKQKPYQQRKQNTAKDGKQWEGVVNHFCDACDRGFEQEVQYHEHVAGHQKCYYEECSYVAAPKLVQLHIRLQHNTGLAKKIWQLESQDDIQKWLEERKKNFPTKSNIVKKKEEVEARKERGEVIETKYFGKMKGRNQKNQKNRKTDDGDTPEGGDPPVDGRNKNKNRNRKRNNRNRNKNKQTENEEETPNKKQKVEQENCHTVTEEICNVGDDNSTITMDTDKSHSNIDPLSILAANKEDSDSGVEDTDISLTQPTSTGLKDMNTETDGEPLVLKGGLGMILSCYDEDDNEISDEEVDNKDSEPEEKPVNRKEFNASILPAESETPEKAFNATATQNGHEMNTNGETKSNNSIKTSVDNKINNQSHRPIQNTNGSTNNQSHKPIQNTNGSPNNQSHKPIQNTNGSTNNQSHKPIQNTNGSTSNQLHKPIQNTKSRTDIWKKKDLFNSGKKSTLLEKLLAEDIRHERNVILQCVHYIVKNKFFGKDK